MGGQILSRRETRYVIFLYNYRIYNNIYYNIRAHPTGASRAENQDLPSKHPLHNGFKHTSVISLECPEGLESTCPRHSCQQASKASYRHPAIQRMGRWALIKNLGWTCLNFLMFVFFDFFELVQ